MKKVVVAMSGGVDSSVAVLLLKKQGYDVIGVFMQFWHEQEELENRCCSLEAKMLARQVALKFKMPFITLNYRRPFKKLVVEPFLKGYTQNLTPNPCIWCNQFIKFDLLLKEAKKLGADYLATGHYARTDGQHLFTAKDKSKDQSYFLYHLTKNQLKHIIFPLGDYTKTQVRAMATKYHLPTAKRRDSQEICFVGKNYYQFLHRHLPGYSGKICDEKGKILNKHHGLFSYTIGQKVPIGGKGPYYVFKKDRQKNIIYVSNKIKYLLNNEVYISDIHWIARHKVKFPVKIKARTRYRMPRAEATIISNKKIIFKEPQLAITPGQSVVFYRGIEVLGGAIIKNVS